MLQLASKVFSKILSTSRTVSLNKVVDFNVQSIRNMGYKLKTHKGASKRFMKTSTGHKRGHAGKQHLNFGMSGEQRGRLRGTVGVTKAQSKLLDRMQIR